MTGVRQDDDTAMDIIMNIEILVAAAIGSSLFLASVSWIFFGGTGIPTLGMLVWNAFHLPYARENGYALLGENLFRQFTVDWAFWFVLVCAFCWLCRRLRQKAEKS
jgi:hypothetical protein